MILHHSNAVLHFIHGPSFSSSDSSFLHLRHAHEKSIPLLTDLIDAEPESKIEEREENLVLVLLSLLLRMSRFCPIVENLLLIAANTSNFLSNATDFDLEVYSYVCELLGRFFNTYLPNHKKKRTNSKPEFLFSKYSLFQLTDVCNSLRYFHLSAMIFENNGYILAAISCKLDAFQYHKLNRGEEAQEEKDTNTLLLWSQQLISTSSYHHYTVHATLEKVLSYACFTYDK